MTPAPFNWQRKEPAFAFARNAQKDGPARAGAIVPTGGRFAIPPAS